MNRETFTTQQMYILDSYIEHMRNTRALVTNALNMYNEQERMFRTMLLYSLNEEIGNNSRAQTNQNEPMPTSRRSTTAEQVVNILNRRSQPRARTATTTRRWGATENSNANTNNDTNPVNHLNPGRHARDFVQFFTAEDLQDVVVTPSERDVRIATTTRRYDTLHDPINDVCPITQLRFEPNDMVTRIDHCGHIFSAIDLTRWFRHSVRCPVCRFDIREANISSRHYNRAVNEIIERHRNRENNATTNNNENIENIENSDNTENDNRSNEDNDTNARTNEDNEPELDVNTLRNMTSLILQDINNGSRNATPTVDASGNAVFTYNLLSIVDLSNNHHMTFHS